MNYEFDEQLEESEKEILKEKGFATLEEVKEMYKEDDIKQ